MHLWNMKLVINFCRSRSKVKVTRGQKCWSAISRKLLGRFTPNKDQNVKLVKGFPPIYLVLELPWIYTTIVDKWSLFCFCCLKIWSITDLCSFIDCIYLMIIGAEGLFIGYRCSCPCVHYSMLKISSILHYHGLHILAIKRLTPGWHA